jgi:hypothetical protein
MDVMLAPATAEHIAAWLGPFNAAIRNPQGQADFAIRVKALAMLLDDLPAACFVAETRRLLRVEFFPSAEDIRRALEPVAQPWRRRRAALDRLAKAPTASAPQPPATGLRSVEDIAAVRAKAAETKAELARIGEWKAGGRVQDNRPTASPLRPAELVAEYARQAAMAPPDYQRLMLARADAMAATLGDRPRDDVA